MKRNMTPIGSPSKVKQNNNLSTSKTKAAKNSLAPRSYKDHYQEFFMYRDHPVSDGFLQKLACDLIDYVENPALDHEGLMRLEAFFISKRILINTAQGWMRRSPEFKEVCETAKLILGMRRENGALRKKFDPGMVQFSMGEYDPEWKKITEWKAKLKAESDMSLIPQTVIFKSFEESKS